MQEGQIKHPEVLSVMANSLMEILEPTNERKEQNINIVKNLVYLVRWEKTQSGKKGSRHVTEDFESWCLQLIVIGNY